MGWWRISTDTLAGSRFVVSALAETSACLLTLAKGRAAHPGERAWFDARLPAYRARLADDPITELLLRATRAGYMRLRPWNSSSISRLTSDSMRLRSLNERSSAVASKRYVSRSKSFTCIFVWKMFS